MLFVKFKHFSTEILSNLAKLAIIFGREVWIYSIYQINYSSVEKPLAGNGVVTLVHVNGLKLHLWN